MRILPPYSWREDAQTAKHFKVSLKPFQRLGRVRGGSPEKKPLAGNGAAAPINPHILFYNLFYIEFIDRRIIGDILSGEYELFKGSAGIK